MASQQGATQVLAQLGGGWLQCQDAQGVFYYNSETNQSSSDPPPQLAAAPAAQQQAPAQPQAAAQPQAKVKQTLGDFQICEDAQGEFYVHTPSGQTFEQPPPQLVQLYQAQAANGAQPQAPKVNSAAPPVQYAAAPAAQCASGPTAASAAPAAAPQAKVKQTLGDFQICEDAQGEYYVHTPSGQTFEQPPPQLVQLYQAQNAPAAQPQAKVHTSAPPVQYSAAPAAQYASAPTAAPAAAPQAKVKMVLGDYQVCEDAQGEYYVHTPSGQTFEQPPPQLVQLYQAQAANGAQPQAPKVNSAAPPVQYAAAPAAQYASVPKAAPAAAPQGKVKMVLGDWQVCEDAQGEYYVHTPSGQTFDQPPPQLVQLYQSQAAPGAQPQAKVNYASAPQQHPAVQQQYAASQQQYAAAAMPPYGAAPQHYAAAAQQHYGAAPYAAAQAGQYAPPGAGAHNYHY